MAYPYPEDKSDLNFNRAFLEYIKGQPFYVLSRRKEPIVIGNIENDGFGDFYYVGDLKEDNYVFEPDSRVDVYYFEKNSRGEYQRQVTTYWVETIIDTFEEGSWVLVDWYKNGMTYKDVVQHLLSLKDFNPFGDLNESEEWFEQEDYTKYLRMGQKFRFNSRTGSGATIIGKIIRVKEDYVWVAPISLSNNPIGAGTRFSNNRILQLLVNGDWVPVETSLEESTKKGYLSDTWPHSALKPGQPIYCHTSAMNFIAGKWYTIYDIEYNSGINGEDVIRIYDGENEHSKSDTWTIQKDENGLNYENWFSVGDPEFDPNQAFNSLYESEEDLGWAEDLVSNVHDGWQLLKSGLKDFDNFNVRIVIRDYDYLICGINSCGIDDELINLVNQKNYEFKLLGFNPRIGKTDVDCGCMDEENEDYEPFSGAVRLGYETLEGDDSFWFLEDWVDLVFTPKNLNESEEYSLNDLGFDSGGEEFGKEIPYSYLRVGDEIMFTTNPFRGCGFPEEYERGKILKTNGTKFLVKTNEITHCNANLQNWHDGSSTMLEGLIEKCEARVPWSNNYDFHNCIEIDRRTQSKYYMVYKREELNESEDLEWAEELYSSADEIVTSKNAFVGAKVVKGKDWDFGYQGRGSVYGIIQQGGKINSGDFTIIENNNGLRMEDYTQSGSDSHHQIWVNVNWVDEDGVVIDENTYRVGPDYFDLSYYIGE